MTTPTPIHLPGAPRYQIRPLTPPDAPHALAILAHANVFHSPLWSTIYPDSQPARAYFMHQAALPLITLNITSGLCFGVFDTEYAFKRPESAAAGPGGKLWWDYAATEATGAELLEQMDFPLVSVAMAYDVHPPRDGTEWAPILDVFPAFKHVSAVMERRDTRDPASWKPTRAGEVVRRAGTATRQDYAGRGLAGALTRWHVGEMRARGYRGYQVTTAHPGLSGVFLGELPGGVRGRVVARVGTGEVEGEEGGKVFAGVKKEFDCCLIWVDLR
ncbi:hypothetical protein QBC39DRAFT_262811 [Podospora conica]|nr:hypothetical protein QBC39DRAFT_262811 [Schizothecium conicum]